MDELPNRIKCSECGAANFKSSEQCIQCGAIFQKTDEPNHQPEEAMPRIKSHISKSAEPPARKGASANSNQAILGFVFAGLGMTCCPIFAVAGIVMGVIASSSGDKLGVWVIVANVAALVIQVGMMSLGFIVPMLGGSKGFGGFPFPSQH